MHPDLYLEDFCLSIYDAISEQNTEDKTLTLLKIKKYQISNGILPNVLGLFLEEERKDVSLRANEWGREETPH